MERDLLAGLGWDWHLEGALKEGGLNLTGQGTLPLGAQLGPELLRLQFLKSLLPQPGTELWF